METVPQIPFHINMGFKRLMEISRCYVAIFSDNSISCSTLTRDGASVSGQAAFCVFGKAITSRIESAPVIIITNRSKPKAIPPWGGVPYSKASSRKPNLFRASSSPSPRALKINA